LIISSLIEVEMTIKYLPSFTKILLLLSGVIIYFTSINVYAQEISPDFLKRVQNYQDQNPQEMVYLHTDRNVYAPGDRINFKAYIRDVYNPSVLSASKNIHLILVDQHGNTQQEKIFQIDNNLSSGEFNLVAGLTEGEYKLIAWTNGMESGLPQNVFQKKIFIKDRIFPEHIIKLSAGQTRYLPGDLARIEVELFSITGKALKKKRISYIASFNDTSFEAKDTRTDKLGKAVIDLTLPENDEMGLTIVEVAFENLGSTISNSILVPTSKTPVWIDFAPEGGLFVNGFETQIGFRAYDFLGNSTEVEGQVLNGKDEVVQTIKTTGLGFGSFTIRANASDPLKVRLTKPSGIDIDFNLPQVQERGIQLALVSKDESKLDFVINTDIEDAAIPLHAVVELNGNLIFEKRFNLKTKSELSIPISPDLPTGVIKTNLLSRTGDVLAHRSLFISSGQQFPDQNLSATEQGNQRLITAQISNYSDTQATYLSASIVDKNLSPEWRTVQDIMSWFLLGPTADYAAFPAGFLVNPSLEDMKIIDHYLLFQMDNNLDWKKIKSGKSSRDEKTKTEFRDQLKLFYQPGDFEMLISQIRQTQFFYASYIDQNENFREFVAENKGELEKLGYFPMKLSSDEFVQQQLAAGQSIMSVLKSIKPYKIMGNKIVFRGNDSYNYQGGVIIVINGVPRGTDPGVLSSISPYDVESIKASASISDIQKYSGLNSTGVIEITTKKSDLSSESPVLPGYSFPTLFWDPELQVDTEGVYEIILQEQKIISEQSITVQGVDSNGKFLIWKQK